jgi:hypothetical protein
MPSATKPLAATRQRYVLWKSGCRTRRFSKWQCDAARVAWPQRLISCSVVNQRSSNPPSVRTKNAGWMPSATKPLAATRQRYVLWKSGCRTRRFSKWHSSALSLPLLLSVLAQIHSAFQVARRLTAHQYALPFQHDADPLLERKAGENGNVCPSGFGARRGCALRAERCARIRSPDLPERQRPVRRSG